MIYNGIKIPTAMSDENKSLFINSFKEHKQAYGVCYGEYFTEETLLEPKSGTGKHIAFVINDIYILENEMFMDIKMLSTSNGNKLKERLLGKHEFGVDLYAVTYAEITSEKRDTFAVSNFVSVNISETHIETDTTGGVVKTTQIQDHYELKESALSNVVFDPFESTGDLDADIRVLDLLQMKLNLVDTMYNAFKREDDKPYFHLDFLLQKYLGLSQDDIEKMKNTEK